jgi:hypothetical protein
MKKIQFLGLSLMALGALGALAARAPNAVADDAEAGPVKASAPIQRVFVPDGFDDNDNVEVILHGHFPNSCMKSGPVEFDVNRDLRVISIRSEVYVYSPDACLQVEIPFIQKVSLGNLEEGVWKIEVGGNLRRQPLPLVVRHAKSAAPDEVLYAPVEDVLLLPEPQGDGHRVVVSGQWPQASAGKCFELVRIESYLGKDHSLVVLPIAELKNEGECKSSDVRRRVFSSSAPVAEKLPQDVLVHVRVLNGESLNKFFE